MGMTMTQKILAKHAGLESVRAGQLIQAKLDLVLGNDITAEIQDLGFWTGDTADQCLCGKILLRIDPEYPLAVMRWR